MFTLPLVPSVSRTAATAAVVALFAGVAACAPAPSSSPAVSGPQALASTGQAASTPVLLSCPAGQQPLMRQVVVQGALVPQVECVAAVPMAPAGMAMVAAAAPTYTPQGPVHTYVPQAVEPYRTTPAPRPRARTVAYDDGVVEYRRPTKRSWQKSAVIIGSAAGAGAGVGALSGGKKGALIGAAVGGGAATIWDQITRRQPR